MEMELESALARKTKHVATSTGCLCLPKGVLRPIDFGRIRTSSQVCVEGLWVLASNEEERKREEKEIRSRKTYIESTQIGPEVTTFTQLAFSLTIWLLVSADDAYDRSLNHSK